MQKSVPKQAKITKNGRFGKVYVSRGTKKLAKNRTNIENNTKCIKSEKN